MHLTKTAEALMTPDDRAFFEILGKRIAELRAQLGITQVQLAEILGYSQQQILSFEKGRRKVPASSLPELAKALGVSIDELLGVEDRPGKRGPTPKLQQQLELLSRMPRSKQRFVSDMLDAVLQQARR
jgi:transcriptional regulator with XRE-family HTH domain